MATPAGALALVAPGAQVVVRDEEWLVRSVQHTRADGLMVKVIGTSELVRDQEATFFTELDNVAPLRPEDTRLVTDETPGYRRSRLFLGRCCARRRCRPASRASPWDIASCSTTSPSSAPPASPWSRSGPACSSPIRSAWARPSRSASCCPS